MASRFPPLPAADFARRRNLENMPGIHLIFDTPVKYSEGSFPSAMFAGVSVTYLVYTEESPVKFRLCVACYKGVDKGYPFVEMGTFPKSKTNIIYKTQLLSGDKNEDAHVSTQLIPEACKYHWMTFSFSGTKTTEYIYNGIHLGKLDAIELSQMNGYTAWRSSDNNMTILEIHLTYPASLNASIFPTMGQANVTADGNLRPGGRLVVVGEYTSGSVSCKVKTGENDTQTRVITSTSSGHVTIVLTMSTARLTCQAENKKQWVLEDYEMDGTTTIAITGFKITSVHQFTGMSKWGDNCY